MPQIVSTEVPKPTNDKEFEEIICDLYSRVWNSNNIEVYGVSGQKQDGVDIYLSEVVEDRVVTKAIQCKIRKGKLKFEDVVKEVDMACDFRIPISEYILATTASRDTNLQIEVSKLSNKNKLNNGFTISVRFWEDIVSLLMEYQDVYRKYYSQFIMNSNEISFDKGSVYKSNVSPKLMVGFLLDFSKNSFYRVLNNYNKYKNSNLNIGIENLLFKVNSYTRNNLTEEELMGVRLFISGLGFSDSREKISSILYRIGIKERSEMDSSPNRDLFLESNDNYSLNQVPTLHELKVYWPRYEKAIYKHLIDIGGANIDIDSIFQHFYHRFTKDLEPISVDKSIVFLIMDYQSLNEIGSESLVYLNKLKSKGIRICSIIVSDKYGDNELILRSHCDNSWNSYVKDFFEKSSFFDSNDSFDRELVQIAIENKWRVQENSKMFFLIGQDELIRKIVDLFVTPITTHGK